MIPTVPCHSADIITESFVFGTGHDVKTVSVHTICVRAHVRV